MRRYASEIIRELEYRVARLEKDATFTTKYQYFQLDRRWERVLKKKVDESLENLSDYPRLDENHDVLFVSSFLDGKAELWKDRGDKEAEISFTTDVLFADKQGNKSKKSLVWILEIDPSVLEYDMTDYDDGPIPILEESIFKAALASRSKLSLSHVY